MVFDVTQKQATWFAKDVKIMVCIPILNRTFDGFISRIKSASYGNGMVVMAEFVYSENTGADIFMHLAVEGCDKHIIARVSADKSYEEK